MAMGKGENAVDAAQRESAQPSTEEAPKSDTRAASPDAERAAFYASMQPRRGRVAMVTRDVNGDPAAHQGVDFEVIGCSDDDPQEVKDAAWNKAGEAQGAKNYDPAKHEMDMDRRDREAELRDENAAIARASYNPAGLYEGKKG